MTDQELAFRFEINIACNFFFGLPFMVLQQLYCWILKKIVICILHEYKLFSTDKSNSVLNVV